ncbi:hypothetical protein [Aurantiacibacter hainanensis]|uniref:hypothetical protein n=1 Tax=Aurantiacibacter hainanensis TaxID=3076114 RepID=UPI0030C692B3
MRSIVTLFAATLVISCAEEPETEVDEPADVAATTANGSPPGTYYVAADDGTASLVTLHADGTYSQITPEGTYPAQGTFEVVDGKTCFKVRQVGAETLCYTETQRAADGSYTATPDGGEALTVTPYSAGDVSLPE